MIYLDSDKSKLQKIAAVWNQKKFFLKIIEYVLERYSLHFIFLPYAIQYNAAIIPKRHEWLDTKTSKAEKKGAYTIAQDKKSPVIYGMPKVVQQMRAAKTVMNPNEIVNYLKKFV